MADRLIVIRVALLVGQRLLHAGIGIAAVLQEIDFLKMDVQRSELAILENGHNGFAPHCFTDVKRWSITPTVYASVGKPE